MNKKEPIITMFNHNLDETLQRSLLPVLKRLKNLNLDEENRKQYIPFINQIAKNVLLDNDSSSLKGLGTIQTIASDTVELFNLGKWEEDSPVGNVANPSLSPEAQSPTVITNNITNNYYGKQSGNNNHTSIDIDCFNPMPRNEKKPKIETVTNLIPMWGGFIASLIMVIIMMS